MQPLTMNFARPMYIRDIMVANGDAAKPIWISEMNSNAVPNDPASISGVGNYGMVTLEQQARFAPLAYQRVMEEWPWVGVVSFWFFKPADDRERNQAMYYFRMVEPDFSPLPVYEAMREYIAGVIPTLYPGVHQEDHWALEYGGEWTGQRADESAGGRIGDYQQAAAPGATVHFWFEGASLTLAPGPGDGVVNVVVDGGAPRRVTLNGRAVRLVNGWLRQARHEVTLTAVSGEVGVDEFIVQEPWHPSCWLVVSVLGLLAVASAMLVRRARR
jgi:hypothetical protein